MNKWILLSLIVLGGLAGCSGFDEGGTETPEVQSENDSLKTVEFPAGTSGSGIEDVDFLLAAHREVVSDTDFTFHGYVSQPLGTLDGVEQLEYRTVGRSDVKNERAVIRGNSTASFLNGTVDFSNSYTDFIIEDTGYQTPDIRYYLVNDFEDLHSSTLGREAILRKTFERANADATEVVTENGTTYIRFRLSYPSRNADDGYALIRTDGLIKEIKAPDGNLSALHSSYTEEHIELQDGFDGFRITTDRDLNLTTETDDAEERILALDGRPYPYRMHNRLLITVVDPDSSGGGTGCGTNDGDPSYDEDNDRDNDGLCDED